MLAAHIHYKYKFKNVHTPEFFYTCTASGAFDQYEVCPPFFRNGGRATQDRVKRSYLGRGGWQGKTKSKPLVEDVGENVGEDEEEDDSDPGGEEVEPPG